MTFPAGCTAYFKLEDETEEVGGLDLTNQNTTTFVAGALNNCANFVGSSSQKLYVGSAPALQDPDAWSCNFWYRSANANGGDGAWIGKGAYSSPGVEWGVRPVDNSSVYVYIDSGGAFPHGVYNLGSNFLNDSTWHCCGVRYYGAGAGNADRLRVWSDGVEKTASSFQHTIPSTTFNGSGDFIIGGFLSNLLGYSTIRIDEVGFWAGTALDDADFVNLFNSGTPLPFESSAPTFASPLVNGGPAGRAGNVGGRLMRFVRGAAGLLVPDRRIVRLGGA